MKYISTKVSKRMEANKVRSTYHDLPNSLLLALSFSVSSVSLLHVLDQHIKSQLEKTGRASYKLHVLIIDDSSSTKANVFSALLPNLRQRFPLHTYSILSMEELLNHNDVHVGEISEVLKEAQDQSSAPRHQSLQDIISSLPSASSRSDFIDILRRRLIFAFAERRGFSGILFGDSTTRLAERTIAETAKGRGGSLPWLTADNVLPSGVKVIYPLRDLLKKELVLYSETVDPPFEPSIILAKSVKLGPVASKDTTIDGLMSQYFESVEDNYPSIVANVVRTSGRLVPISAPQGSSLCQVCRLPTNTSQKAWDGEQQVLTAATRGLQPVSDKTPSLCYGCDRSLR